MSQLLETGQCIRSIVSSANCEVGSFLGGGTQGEVYKVVLNGQELAVKWYFPHMATQEQRQILMHLAARGRPTPQFLWPLDLTESEEVAGYGYIMPLREDRFRGVSQLMKRVIDPSFRALSTAGLQLADCFFQLHTRGYCYRDINFGNVFLDPDTGEVLICDNDNIDVDGANLAGVVGTPRFMAPEVVLRKAMPSIQSDRFSLAILLFYMLVLHHPLEGEKESAIHSFDASAMTKVYGKEPVFIFDPNDDSNRPHPDYHKNAWIFWPLYPTFLRDLFTRAFSEGIRDPQNGRVLEGEWRTAMVRLRDSIAYCQNCAAENFYDDFPSQRAGQSRKCWSCGHALRFPPRIRIGRNIALLNHDTKLYPHHVDINRTYDFSEGIAEVVRNPTNPNLWGLRNCSSQTWTATKPDGTIVRIEPGKSAALTNGLRIHFGNADGEIRA